jgi:hypothetical protein
MAFEVAEIQSTPNPNALKFVLDRAIAEQPASFFDAEAARGHGLASKLFALPGVCSLLLLGDFVTVNKRPDADWAPIKRGVRKILAQPPDAGPKTKEFPVAAKTAATRRS